MSDTMSAPGVSGPAGGGAAELPDHVARLLRDEALEAGLGAALQIVTVDPDGWPRAALVSAGEVLVLGPTTLRTALWQGSRSAENLERSGRAALLVASAGLACTISVRASRLADLPGPPALAAFEAEVVDVRSDEASYAILHSGITFRLRDVDAVLTRWRATRLALAGLGPRLRGAPPAPCRSASPRTTVI
jgi:hypothetical protein